MATLAYRNTDVPSVITGIHLKKKPTPSKLAKSPEVKPLRRDFDRHAFTSKELDAAVEASEDMIRRIQDDPDYLPELREL